MEVGLRVVEVRRIVGTVGKCGELDANFRYLHRRDRTEHSRRRAMAAAFHDNEFLPPVDLYLLRGAYYVVDGNRRVSTAREMKIEFIDANVTEYVLREHALDMAGALARRRFETETKIINIRLTHENDYKVLLDDIERSPGDGSERARNWYNRVFLPACRDIERAGLLDHYPSLQPGDVYVLILRFYRGYLGGIPEYGDFNLLISGFMFAHAMHRPRVLRFPLFRIFTTRILRKAGG
jgi:hypothetical protein